MLETELEAESDRFDVLLVEDDKLWARAFRLELNASSRFHVTVVPDLAAARRDLEAARRRYDVIVVDPGLPDGSGLTLVAELVESDPSIALAVVTGRWDDNIVNQTLHARADAFARKPLAENGAMKLIFDALQHARRRLALDSPALAHSSVWEPRLPAPLTDAECRVVRLHLAGHSYRRIAAALDISHETVKSHIKSARAKVYAKKGEGLGLAIQRYFLGPGR